jgi:hypothetical protein
MSNQLIKDLTAATGLPDELITRELSQLMTNKGLGEQDVTLDDLRHVMADYLREVIIHAKNKFEDGVEIEEEVPPEQLGMEEPEKE